MWFTLSSEILKTSYLLILQSSSQFIVEYSLKYTHTIATHRLTMVLSCVPHSKSRAESLVLSSQLGRLDKGDIPGNLFRGNPITLNFTFPVCSYERYTLCYVWHGIPHLQTSDNFIKKYLGVFWNFSEP